MLELKKLILGLQYLDRLTMKNKGELHHGRYDN